MMEATALLLATAGFGMLALSMQKHHRDLFGAPPSQWHALALHSIGWVLLGLSFAACILDSGWAIGPVLWLGILTVAALVSALTLTYGPRACRDHSDSRHRSSSLLKHVFCPETGIHFRETCFRKKLPGIRS
ncbi:MAG: DUF3325 domain-containing protein [Hyphomicrobiales bacterium]|nr:DUF3325 domain-containing protein [Hyphomicrobiales bacterium]